MPDLSTYIALASLSVSTLKTAEQQSGSNGGGNWLSHKGSTKSHCLPQPSIPLLHLSGKPKCVMHEMFSPLVSTEAELAVWCSWGYQGMCFSKQDLLELLAK